jgi:hypothetical protein
VGTVTVVVSVVIVVVVNAVTVVVSVVTIVVVNVVIIVVMNGVIAVVDPGDFSIAYFTLMMILILTRQKNSHYINNNLEIQVEIMK